MHCGLEVSEGDTITTTPGSPLQQRLTAETLGEYEVLREIGRGGMASVFLAHEIALDRKVAIKVMDPSLQAEPGMAERFRQEARTAAALSHPNIIPIYAVKDAGELQCFVMRYVAGRPLDLVLRDTGPLPIAIVRAILTQVGSALTYAHGQGVIHRDIKPGNIMIDEDGRIVIADFGIAKVTEQVGVTVVGSTIGTPSYMSPEQCTGRDVSGAADQYSLGVVAYELLTGKPPFEADSAVALAWAHVNEPVPSLKRRRHDCPPELSQAVEQMLAKAPEDRWPDLTDGLEVAGWCVPGPGDPLVHDLARLARPPAGGPQVGPSTPTSPLPATRRMARPAVDRVASVVLVEPPPAVRVGESVQFRALPRSASGTDLSEQTISWGCSDHSILRVTESGWATALEPGSAIVIATCQGKAARVAISATGPRISRIRFPWRHVAVSIGEQGLLRPEVLDDQDEVVDPVPLVWTSADPAVARVTDGGEVTGVAAGETELHAELGSIAATLAINVTRVGISRLEVRPTVRAISAGDEVQLTASATDSFRTRLENRLVTWVSNCPAAAVVSPTGLLRGVGEGLAEITVSCGNRNVIMAVKVKAPVVSSVLVLPSRPQLAPGKQLPLAAQALNPKGGRLTGMAATWESSNESIVAVSPEGVLAGIRPGEARVAATINGRRRTVPVLVTPFPDQG